MLNVIAGIGAVFHRWSPVKQAIIRRSISEKISTRATQRLDTSSA
ncbi:hypothetical protein AB0M95_32835 [Sphaerisporangium sp. NPDC051017]